MIIVTFGFMIPTPSRLGQGYLVINVALFLGNGKDQSLPFSGHTGFLRLSEQESLCFPFLQHMFPGRDGQGISMDEDKYREGDALIYEKPRYRMKGTDPGQDSRRIRDFSL